MRIESSSSHSTPLAVHCSICGMHRDENGDTPGKELTLDERLDAFDLWLADHGLTRALLKNTYHLRMESFFDLDVNLG